MKINKTDITLLVSPFLLTAAFVFVGYSILIQNTPEARISPPAAQTQTEILEASDFQVITPSAPLIDSLSLMIVQVPDNQAALDNAIQLAANGQFQGLYLVLPISLNSDNSLILTQASSSSEENVTRWVKKTISTAHEHNLHVLLALTINAQTTVSDLPQFAANYNQFVPKWASLATEYGVAFFSPGITVGHPLYSNLSDQQLSQLLNLIQSTIRNKYSGRIGIGYCCATESRVQPGGYSFITAIPTPEFPLAELSSQITKFTSLYKMTYTFEYDRNSSQVTSINLNL